MNTPTYFLMKSRFLTAKCVPTMLGKLTFYALIYQTSCYFLAPFCFLLQYFPALPFLHYFGCQWFGFLSFSSFTTHFLFSARLACLLFSIVSPQPFDHLLFAYLSPTAPPPSLLHHSISVLAQLQKWELAVTNLLAKPPRAPCGGASSQRTRDWLNLGKTLSGWPSWLDLLPDNKFPPPSSTMGRQVSCGAFSWHMVPCTITVDPHCQTALSYTYVTLFSHCSMSRTVVDTLLMCSLCLRRTDRKEKGGNIHVGVSVWAIVNKDISLSTYGNTEHASGKCLSVQPIIPITPYLVLSLVCISDEG